MLCGRKRVSSRSISHFAMLFRVHYLLAVGDKPLGIDHAWLVKLARRIAQNEWIGQDWAFGKWQNLDTLHVTRENKLQDPVYLQGSGREIHHGDAKGRDAW